jgi:hypothetical protein
MTVAVSSAAMRSILKDLDVAAAGRAWGEADDAKTLVMLHMARTAAKSIPMGLRAYSHRWLVDHGLPSQLPDRLKPKAERMYPQVVSAVGIAVKMRDRALAGAGLEIRRSMEDMVLDAEADGKLLDTRFVKTRMMEARDKTKRKLWLAR